MSETSFIITGAAAGLVGSWLGMGLFGLTTAQTYIYWMHYPKDKLWIKALVAFVWLVNALHTICVCHMMYFLLITTGPSLRNVWSLGTSILLHTIMFSVVLSYYTRTIFLLANKKVRWWLTGAIIISLLFAIGFSLDVTIRILMSSSMLTFLTFTTNTILPGYSLQLVTDVFVTGSLCGILYRAKDEFGPRSTQNKLNTLIIYAAGRGLITLVTDLTIVLALAINSDQLWYSALEYMITGLYANSLMVMLNSRRPSEVEDVSLETLPTFQVALTTGTGRGTFDVGNSTSTDKLRAIDNFDEGSTRNNTSQGSDAKMGM